MSGQGSPPSSVVVLEIPPSTGEWLIGAGIGEGLIGAGTGEWLIGAGIAEWVLENPPSTVASSWYSLMK